MGCAVRMGARCSKNFPQDADEWERQMPVSIAAMHEQNVPATFGNRARQGLGQGFHVLKVDSCRDFPVRAVEIGRRSEDN